MIHRMKVPNYDSTDDNVENNKQLYDFMPDRPFRMLICGESGSGKSNLLTHLIYKLLYYDKIYLHSKNLQQQKYQDLMKICEPISNGIGYNIIETYNDKIVPLSKLPDNNQKMIVFDDFLNTGKKNDSEIRNYWTNSGNKNCSCIYLSQSFF